MPPHPTLVVKRLYSEVYNQPDIEAGKRAARLLCEQPDPVIEQYVALRTAFPDWQCNPDTIIREGEKVAVRWSGHGTHNGVLQHHLMTIPPTQQRIEIMGMSMYLISMGQITGRVWSGDSLDLLVQLGAQVVPPAAPSPPSSSPSRPSHPPRLAPSSRSPHSPRRSRSRSRTRGSRKGRS
jgi:predicted ester cyclase